MSELIWKRVEAALDARLDPLDDADLAAALSEDPQILAGVTRLMRRLEVLPVSTEPSRRPHRGLRVLALTACILALVTASLLMFARRPTGDITNEQSVAAASSTIPTAAADAGRPTVSLVIKTTTPERTRPRRAVLEPHHVLTWNLEER